MGLFYVSASLTGPTGRSEAVDLLVDTGATLRTVPRSLADRLALRTLRAQAVQLAGGLEDMWPLAEVRLQIDGCEVTTPCFIAPGGPALLGAVALESLFLSVDPVAKRLIPVKGIVAGNGHPSQQEIGPSLEARRLLPARG
jgi:predicted aspartyl protease